jgi:hypothetical protein
MTRDCTGICSVKLYMEITLFLIHSKVCRLPLSTEQHS